jgi:hypothetical protein
LAIKAGGIGLSDFDVAAAIVFAVDRGAKIINLSLGGVRSTETERRAIDYAVARDVLLVAAVGNEYRKGNPVEYPAAYLQPVGSNGQGGRGLSVGATTVAGARASFSNTGSHVSLAAPGENVFGAISARASKRAWPTTRLPGSSSGLYGYSSGTSFAAPQVAGAAALVWAANPMLSAAQVADILEQSASGRGAWNPELGFGVLDTAAAVERARGAPAVSLQAIKLGSRVNLVWRGNTGSAYRLLVEIPGQGTRVLRDRTTSVLYTYEAQGGKTYTFVVEALDAAGNVLARSAPAPVTLGQAQSRLSLTSWRPYPKRRSPVIVLAFLQPGAPDVTSGQRVIQLEQRSGGTWRMVAYGPTDAGGRIGWVASLPRGNYVLRARFGGASDLSGATSKALTLRIR